MKDEGTAPRGGQGMGSAAEGAPNDEVPGAGLPAEEAQRAEAARDEVPPAPGGEPQGSKEAGAGAPDGETPAGPDAEPEVPARSGFEPTRAHDAAPDAPAPRAQRKGRGLALPLASILLTPLIALAVLVQRPRAVELIVDNGNSFPIEVFVAGERVGEVPRRSNLKVAVAAGPLALRAVEAVAPDTPGRAELAFEGETGPVAFLGERPTYVWNVGGATRHYWVWTKGYGDQQDAPHPAEPFVPEGELFALPDDLLPSLDSDFPAEVHEPRRPDGSRPTGAIRKQLLTVQFVNERLLEQQLAEQLEAMQRPGGALDPPRLLDASGDAELDLEGAWPAEPAPAGAEGAREPAPFPPVPR